MTYVVIFRASDRPEVGPTSHLPAEGLLLPALGVPNPPTVLRTLCGKVGIGRAFDRDDATCAMCVAMSGRHPGGRGKRYLHKQLEASR